MNDKSIAIVILNYQAYWETMECVESILKHHLILDGIVIVDNASSNDSYKRLAVCYKNNANIKVVKTKRNLGFAKGNNVGIKVAKQIWNSQFVMLLNSDTVILDEHYLDKIMERYTSGIGVMQTAALRIDNSYTKKSYESYALSDVINKFFSAMFKYCFLYYPLKNLNKDALLPPWISGCDILLTPDYFAKFRGLCSLTFMYGEEYILAMYLKKAHLDWVLVEDAVILHKEMQSTPTEFRMGRRTKDKRMVIAHGIQLLVRMMPVRLLQLITNRGDWE